MIGDICSMPELDELIRAGWEDVPQDKIPEDWRNRRAPAYSARWPKGAHSKAGSKGGSARWDRSPKKSCAAAACEGQ
jgi:hypothetical protein